MKDRIKNRQKERARILKSLHKKIADQAKMPVAPPPRYDDVFFEGVAWLDNEGGLL
jgi:hypothetical protein